MQQLLDVKAAAELVGTSTRNVMRWTATREVRHVKLGALLRFRIADVNEFIASRVVATRRDRRRRRRA
jgi:excisionase family DNA binding protein